MNVFRLPAHTVARVHGERALEFLDAMTTQDLSVSFEDTLTCLLDDKGCVLGVLRVLKQPGVTIYGANAADAINHLAKISPLSDCEITIEGIHVYASDAELNGTPFIRAEHGFEFFGPYDGDLSEDASYERARITRGEPLYGVDITSEMLINETPLMTRAVSFTKGCYPGQESVARVHNLGKVRRRVVHIRGDAARGDIVMLDGSEAGAVTSATEGWAIAYVRAEAVDSAAATIGGRAVEVRAL